MKCKAHHNWVNTASTGWIKERWRRSLLCQDKTKMTFKSEIPFFLFLSFSFLFMVVWRLPLSNSVWNESSSVFVLPKKLYSWLESLSSSLSGGRDSGFSTSNLQFPGRLHESQECVTNTVVNRVNWKNDRMTESKVTNSFFQLFSWLFRIWLFCCKPQMVVSSNRIPFSGLFVMSNTSSYCEWINRKIKNKLPSSQVIHIFYLISIRVCSFSIYVVLKSIPHCRLALQISSYSLPSTNSRDSIERNNPQVSCLHRFLSHFNDMWTKMLQEANPDI
jgi:hypothetical protein